MPGLSMWILQSLATELQSSVIHPTLQVDALFGVVLVAHHFGMDAGQVEVGRRVFAAPRDDHLGFRRFAQQGLQDRLNGKKLQIDRGV